MKLIIILLLAPGALSAGSEIFDVDHEYTKDWCYRKGSCGPNTWKQPGCRADITRHKSPINIPADFENLKRPLPDDIIYLDKSNHSIDFFTVNWHVGGFHAVYSKGERVYVKWGFNETYALNSLHFHWGDKSAYGSEHTLGGRAYAGEIHMVYYNISYKHGVYEALETEDPNAVLILAVFVDVVPTYSETNVLYKIVNTLKDCGPGVSYTTEHNNGDGWIHMGEFFKDDIFDYAYAYTGSLTSPPCSPVRWLVLRRPVLISQEDFERYTTEVVINDFTPNNFRPLQKPTDQPRLVKIRYVPINEWI